MSSSAVDERVVSYGRVQGQTAAILHGAVFLHSTGSAVKVKVGGEDVWLPRGTLLGDSEDRLDAALVDELVPNVAITLKIAQRKRLTA